MKIILPLLSIFLIIFIVGCDKTETKVTTQVIKAADPEVIGVVEIEEEIEEEEEEDIFTVRLCHDTDNGIVRWVNGSVFGFYNNATRFEFNDYCQNFNYLWEFYCEDERPLQRIFLCTNGCEDNHCL